MQSEPWDLHLDTCNQSHSITWNELLTEFIFACKLLIKYR